MNDWKIEYGNDTGLNDDCFWEWWAVTDGKREFKSGDEESSKWLCDLLNAAEK